MTRIAVLGANGQVGAEVCLLFKERPGVELSPICRNAGGSSFLRHHGMSCRHGLPADPEQSRRLLNDADVVLNFALAQGLPREARRIHTQIITNTFRSSSPRAINVYFSTMAVYGSRALGRLRFRGAYAREKLFCERLARRESARSGKPLFIFRLGHVCGDLQNITGMIRERITSGDFTLPGDGEAPSNTVYSASIVEAVSQLIAGRLEPETYDLISHPDWSWRKVYEYEAAQIETNLRLAKEPSTSGLALPPRATGLRTILGRTFQWGARSGAVRDLGRALLPYLPADLNLRLQALHGRSRARREIAELVEPQTPEVLLPEPWIPRNPVVSLTDPAELRRDPANRLPEHVLG